MLTDGFNHVAVLTGDMDRFIDFYVATFGAEVAVDHVEEGRPRFCILSVGPLAELNVFEIDGNEEHRKQAPMFGRGRLDHLALRAADIDAFVEIRSRLRDVGASDGYVSDFGPILSLFYRDPDGLESELVVANPDAVPGEYHGPGTPSARFAHDMPELRTK
jgi:catechol 2,3-dioxygenase-like lactoylglutathione lyase family enzyme